MLCNKKIIFFCLGMMLGLCVVAQKNPVSSDTVVKPAINVATSFAKDSVKPYSPRKAIIHSAIIPGWGQITNKKYWKVPIVYGMLGTTGYLFFRNLKQYREAKSAYILATDKDTANDIRIPQPYYSVRFQPERIRAFRNSVRQNVDYSVLLFIVFWGVQVADAAVDAHLKTFDVSDDISFQIKPGYSPMAKTSGISFVMNIK